MCEIFGSCSKKYCELNDYLKEFYSHSHKHPHGWGLALLEGSEASIEKEPMEAIKSDYLKERLKTSVKGRNALAHIRYATIGNVEYVNCHPYTMKVNSGRRWTLVHNGTIFGYKPLDKYVVIQTGDTDSERILLYITEQMNRAEASAKRELNADERFRLLDEIFVSMSKGNKLNILIYDGELMYVHTNYANSLYFFQTGERVTFSTQPLSQEDWQPVPFTRLLAYKDGEHMFWGTDHGNVYVDTEENLKYLYQIFSNL